MSECEQYFHQIDQLRMHRLDDHQQRRLFDHLSGCRACRELFDLQNDLAAAGAGYGDPAPGDLAAMRGRVLDEIRRTSAVPAARPRISQTFKYVLAAAAVFVLVISGFIGGRQSRPGLPSAPPSLLDSIETVALQHSSLSDVEESPNIFSQVRMREQTGDRVRLAFDVTRHVELTRPKDDPLVREVLVHALLNPSSMGARLKAIRYARGVTEPKVRQALVFAMLEDPSLPVRLRAMETLSEDPIDPQLEEALLQVLLQDSSEQMRLKAIDLLATCELSPEDFRRKVTSSGALEDPVVAARIHQLTDL